MKKKRKPMDADNAKYFKALGVVIAGITFYAVINNLGKLGNLLSFIFGVLSPIIIGLCIAFVLNMPLRFFENVVFKKLTQKNGKAWSKLKRPLCLTLSILLVLALTVLILAFVLPEFVDTCASFFLKLPSYMDSLNGLLREYSTRFNLPIDPEMINIDWEWVSAQALDFFNKSTEGDMVGSTVAILVDVFSGIANAVLGFVFSIYVLASKEKLGKLAKSLLYATVKKDTAKNVISIVVLSNKAFAGFISGQCIEVLLIGILCCIGMLIILPEYAVLVSCIIAITAFVPVFGAIVGAIVAALLILIVDPIKALWFLIFILILQQVESNVIYPKIMGKQVGLPGIWVLTAVTIGGALFSVAGIIISVPLCSVLYTLFQKWIIKRLEERNICHRSMSHDASDPKMLVEQLDDYEFNADIEPPSEQPQEAEQKYAEAHQEKAQEADDGKHKKHEDSDNSDKQ